MQKATIAFYNLENLFDTQNGPNIFDEDYTPQGHLQWTKKRYHDKIDDLAEVISKIGSSQTLNMSSLIGLAEVKNKKVLNDLIDRPQLKKHGFAYKHFNSPDERGNG